MEKGCLLVASVLTVSVNSMAALSSAHKELTTFPVLHIHYTFSSWVQPAEYQEVTWFFGKQAPLLHIVLHRNPSEDDDDSSLE